MHTPHFNAVLELTKFSEELNLKQFSKLDENMSIHTKTKGIIFTLGAAMAWALEPIFVKLSYYTSDFLKTSVVRAIFVTLTALTYALITNKGNLKVNLRQLPVLLYIAIAGTIFADLMYLLALTKSPVINVVLIGHMQPVFIILIGLFCLKEDRLTKFDYEGIFFMILAGLFVTTKTFKNLISLKLGSIYDLFVLSATVAWATTGIVTRKYLRQMNAGVVTFYRFLIASTVFLIYLIITKSSMIFPNPYQVLVGITVGMGYIFYYEGIKRIKAAQCAALELSAPFFAAILGFSVFGEKVTPMQISGMVLLFVGILFLSKKEENLP